MGLAPTAPDDFQPWSALGAAAVAAVPWLWMLVISNDSEGHGVYPKVGMSEMPSICPPLLDPR
eukprot:9485536-Pyramimonas_sp.AAC.1